MLKLLNASSSEIQLPLDGGLTIDANGGFAFTDKDAFKDMVAINRVAKNLVLSGSIQVADATQEEIEAVRIESIEPNIEALIKHADDAVKVRKADK